MPRCAKMCQDVPRRAKTCQDVPRCAKMCQVTKKKVGSNPSCEAGWFTVEAAYSSASTEKCCAHPGNQKNLALFLCGFYKGCPGTMGCGKMFRITKPLWLVHLLPLRKNLNKTIQLVLSTHPTRYLDHHPSHRLENPRNVWNPQPVSLNQSHHSIPSSPLRSSVAWVAHLMAPMAPMAPMGSHQTPIGAIAELPSAIPRRWRSRGSARHLRKLKRPESGPNQRHQTWLGNLRTKWRCLASASTWNLFDRAGWIDILTPWPFLVASWFDKWPAAREKNAGRWWLPTRPASKAA